MEPNTDLDPDPHCNVCTLYTVQLANLKLSDPQVVFTAADRHAQAGLVPLGQGCTILLFKIITTTITFRKFNSLPFFTAVKHYLFSARIDGTLVIRSRNCQKTKNMNFHHKSFKMMSFKKKLKIAHARSVTKQCMCTHCTGVHCTQCVHFERDSVLYFLNFAVLFNPFLKPVPKNQTNWIYLFT